MLLQMLGEKCQKKRVELPTLGKPEYLTIVPPMVWGWKKLETMAIQYGYNNCAHSIFFASDIDTELYKEHLQRFSEAVIVPGENFFDPVATDAIIKIIKEVLKEDREEL